MTFNRRRFMGSLTGGLASVLLAPMVEGAIAEACDDLPLVRRVLFVIEGCGMNYERFTPLNVPSGADSDTIDVGQFELSPMMQSLQRHRDLMVLIDGLSNDQGLAGSGHSTGYAALSCVPNYPPSEVGRPGAETLDQYLARSMGQCAIYPHVTVGVGRGNATRLASITADVNARPVPFFCRPQDAYNHIFGPAFSAEGPGLARRTALFDVLRGDIAALKRRLAGPERVKLDEILQQLEVITRREGQIRERGEFIRNCSPDAAGLSDFSIEDRLDGHFSVATAALACGLTRVVTLSSACGYNFFDVPFDRLGLQSTKHQMGHGYHGGLAALDTIHDFHADHIARLIDQLQMLPEGDGTMMDNTLIVWTNENGEQHHARYQRWPVVLLGGRNLGLRTGRYLRMPLKGAPGSRSLADLWNTVCHLMGAPRDDFGAAGLEAVNGPLDGLVDA